VLPESSPAQTALARKLTAGKEQAFQTVLTSARRQPIKEAGMEKILFAFTVLSSILIFFIMFFVVSEAIPVLQANGFRFVFSGGWDEQFVNAWLAPAGEPSWQFGALPLIAGTVYTTAGALLIALPFGLGAAIFLTEMCPAWLRKPLESSVRLLAAIPSVIFGLAGLLLVVPLIADKLISNEVALRMISICALDGTSLLAGMIVLSMMIIPIFIALAADALAAVPRRYKEASLALGVSHWRTIVKVMLPVAKNGILAGAILATGRAIGEAIALSMVTGSVANLPSLRHGPVFFLEPVRTLASTIIDNAEGMSVATCESALFACATFLLVSCIILSLFARLTAGSIQRKGEMTGG
jgi:phosphate transport system permease protein